MLVWVWALCRAMSMSIADKTRSKGKRARGIFFNIYWSFHSVFCFYLHLFSSYRELYLLGICCRGGRKTVKILRPWRRTVTQARVLSAYLSWGGNERGRHGGKEKDRSPSKQRNVPSLGELGPAPCSWWHLRLRGTGKLGVGCSGETPPHLHTVGLRFGPEATQQGLSGDLGPCASWQQLDRQRDRGILYLDMVIRSPSPTWICWRG